MSKGLTRNFEIRDVGVFTPNKMLDDYGFEVYEENPFPIAYLLTFRTYGTWLHGDARTSVRRNGNNRYGGPKVTPSVPLVDVMQDSRRHAPCVLDERQRMCVEVAIKEVCEFRQYSLRALNVRTDHGHVVVSAAVEPEKIVNELKAYATRRLRDERLCGSDEKVWSRGASTRYLWKPRHVEAAVDYVKYCQEDIPFEFRD
ncbi:MAG TPA: transposase [Pyrinomonadaceae bacterium]|nr:transposase [Pyrinomonadaceae bacterium]